MATKSKIPLSIDTALVEEIRALTQERKGGVSRWINEACRHHLKSLTRATTRREKILAARKAKTTPLKD